MFQLPLFSFLYVDYILGVFGQMAARRSPPVQLQLCPIYHGSKLKIYVLKSRSLRSLLTMNSKSEISIPTQEDARLKEHTIVFHRWGLISLSTQRISRKVEHSLRYRALYATKC